MVNMLIQLKVKDFVEWKKVFDSAAGLRSSNGGTYISGLPRRKRPQHV